MAYQKVACWNIATKQFVGYLSSSGDDTSITKDWAGAVDCQWRSDWAPDIFLSTSTAPQDRLLGVGTRSYATWGLPAGWTEAVVPNVDGTGSIALKKDQKRRLSGPYRYLGKDWAYWSENLNDQNILKCELVSQPVG